MSTSSNTNIRRSRHYHFETLSKAHTKALEREGHDVFGYQEQSDDYRKHAIDDPGAA